MEKKAQYFRLQCSGAIFINFQMSEQILRLENQNYY